MSRLTGHRTRRRPLARGLLALLSLVALGGALFLLVQATAVATQDVQSSWSSHDTRKVLVWVYRLTALAVLLALASWRWPQLRRAGRRLTRQPPPE